MTYAETSEEIGALVDRKNRAYGDSFSRSGGVIKILYPNGVKCEQYSDMLAMIRVIDKLFRIATDNDPFGEDSWADIAGYALLKVVENKNQKK